MRIKKRLLLVSFLISGWSQAANVYNNGKDYNHAYFSHHQGLVLTDNSPAFAQSIKNNQLPATWALNLRKAQAGIIDFEINTRPNAINAMAMEADGRFVIAGSSIVQGVETSTIGRVLANGFLDTSFNGGFLSLNSGLVGPNLLTTVILDGSNTGYYVGGRLAIAGVANNAAIAHITNAGTVDTTFGTGQGAFVAAVLFRGIVGIARQSTGSIVYAGQSTGGVGNFSVARITSAGVADPTFTTYTAATMNVTGIAVDSQDRVIVVGWLGNNMLVYRLTVNGSLDISFNGTGSITIAGYKPNAVIVLPDDSIVVAAENKPNPVNFIVIKLTTSGNLDSTFGNGGIVSQNLGGNDVAQALTRLPNGKIAVAGVAVAGRFGTMLLTPQGTLDVQFTIPDQTTVPGTAVFRINSRPSFAYEIGYQNTIDSGLVVVGLANTNCFGAAFYTNVGVE